MSSHGLLLFIERRVRQKKDETSFDIPSFLDSCVLQSCFYYKYAFRSRMILAQCISFIIGYTGSISNHLAPKFALFGRLW